MDAKMGMFFTSMMKGKAAKEQQEREAKERASANKLKDQLIKMQIQNAKIKQIEAAQAAKDAEMIRPYKQKAFETYFGGQAQGQPQHGMGQVGPVMESGAFNDKFSADSFPQPGVADQMAASQMNSMDNMNPQQLAMMQELTGYPLVSAANVGEARKRLDETKAYHKITDENADLTRAQSALVPITKTDRFGNVTQMFVNKNDPQPINIKEASILDWAVLKDFKNPKTGERPPVDTTSQELAAGVKEGKWEQVKKPLSTTDAAKMQGMRTAINGIKKVREKITNPDGTINKKTLAQYRPVPFLNLAVPDFVVKAFGDKDPAGLQIHTLLAQGFESLIRGESGAAVPPEELTRLARRYGVDWTMDDRTINLRLNMLEQILASTVKTIDPNSIHNYDKEDITYRILPNGQKEYVLLPTIEYKQAFNRTEKDVDSIMGD